jgi:hypothetical protein
MFSPASTPSSWHLKLERAADVAVAFATLESVTSVRELLGRAPAAAVSHPHPHRRDPLQPQLRPGRPGVVAARPQGCTPVPVKRARTRAAHRAGA